MNNEEKLICLFEAEGLDVKNLYDAKYQEVFNGQTKRNLLNSLSEEDKVKTANIKMDSFYGLCQLQKFSSKQVNLADDYPTNPFLANYQSPVIMNQKLKTCICYINDEMYSLDYLKDSKTSKDTKNNLMNTVKQKWQTEVKEYVELRSQEQLKYMNEQKNLYEMPKIVSAFFFTIAVVALVFLLLATINLNNEGLRDLFLIVVRGRIGTILYCVFLVLTIIFGYLFSIYDYHHQFDKVRCNYRDIAKKVEGISLFPNRILFSNTRLGDIQNYRRICDSIEKKYSGGVNAPFHLKYNIFKYTFYSLLAILALLGIIHLQPLFGIASLLVILVFSLGGQGNVQKKSKDL